MRSSALMLALVAFSCTGAVLIACSSDGGSAATSGGTSGGTSGASGGTSGTSGTSGASGGTSGTSGGSGASGGTSGTSGGSGASGGTSGTSGGSDAGSDSGDGGAPAVQLIGRFDTADVAGPRFAWPGTRILAAFDGTDVSVKLTQADGFSGGPTYFDVVFDGVVGTPFTVSGTQTVVLAAGKPAGKHTVEISKRTEPVFGTVRFEGFTFAGGTGLLPPPARLARRVEFLGDSTIDGYGIEGDFATTCKVGMVNGAPPQYDSPRKSVAWKTADGLGAELSLLGYSGKGIARNEDGLANDTFPSLYPRTLPDVVGSAWTFSSYVPDAVVVALGGADYSGDPAGTFPATFDAAYLSMLGDIRSHYGAGTYVFLLVWSQYKTYDGVRQKLTEAIDLAIAARPAGEKNYKLVLPEADFATDETGCQLHANAAHHAAMATQLVSGIKTVTMWP